MRHRRLRARTVLAVGAVVTSVWLVALQVDLLEPVELGTVDTRFALRGAAPLDEFVIVDLADLRAQGPRSAYTRTRHARLLDRLTAAGARAVAYDVQFSERGPDEEDNALIRALARAGNVVLATTEADDQGRPNALGGAGAIRLARARVALSFVVQEQGSVRRFLPRIEGLEALSLATAAVALGGELPPPGDGFRWIDFRGPPGTVPVVTAKDVLRGLVPQALLHDRVVVVGRAAAVFPTSAAAGRRMSGAEVHANEIWTVMHGYPLRSPPPWLPPLLVLGVAAAAPLAALRRRLVATLSFAVAAGLAYVVAAQLAFERLGLILPVVYPLGALVCASLACVGMLAHQLAFDRERARDVLARFVPEAVVDRALARARRDLRFDTAGVEGTVVFADLRGFARFAAAEEARAVIEVLNDHLTEASDAIAAHGGAVLGFRGDRVIGVFGAPLPQADHADRALAAAAELLGMRLERLNERVRARGLDDGFGLAVGIHSGRFAAGTVGPERRLEYTAIGDVPNTAARIASLACDSPHPLLLSASTRASLRGQPPGELVCVSTSAIRGRHAPVELWTLRPSAPAPASAAGQELPHAPPRIVPL